jgi:hypothetical protein
MQFAMLTSREAKLLVVVLDPSFILRFIDLFQSLRTRQVKG